MNKPSGWRKAWALVAAVSMAFSNAPPRCFADTVVGSVGALWQPFPAAIDLDGAPYWDNNSFDAPPAPSNIGDYLMNTVGVALPWWGMMYDPVLDVGGAPDPNFYFMMDDAGMTLTLTLEVAGLSAFNVFGWYDVATGAMTPLFTGPMTAGATVSFTPSATYGYYVSTAGAIYFTQSALNVGLPTPFGIFPFAPPAQHFALFQSSTAPLENYWIGVEDIYVDGDFQDMVIYAAAF